MPDEGEVVYRGIRVCLGVLGYVSFCHDHHLLLAVFLLSSLFLCCQHIHPYLYQQNAALLCRGTLQQRVFTLVRVESGEGDDKAAVDQKGKQKDEVSGVHTPGGGSVLSLEEIGRLLESSRTKFLAGGWLSFLSGLPRGGINE